MFDSAVGASFSDEIVVQVVRTPRPPTTVAVPRTSPRARRPRRVARRRRAASRSPGVGSDADDGEQDHRRGGRVHVGARR